MRTRRVRRVLALVPIVLGLAILLPALAQPIKSHLGRSLLSSKLEARMLAPAQEQAEADRWRPWPWAELAPIAELRFPELDERRVVVDSASGEALAWGAGHMAATAPLGGPGVSVVAGHRDGVFALLGQVHEGDAIELTTLTGETIRYVVKERLVVDSRTAQLPIAHDGADELVLTTCWPIDVLQSGPDRLVVRAFVAP